MVDVPDYEDVCLHRRRRGSRQARVIWWCLLGLQTAVDKLYTSCMRVCMVLNDIKERRGVGGKDVERLGKTTSNLVRVVTRRGLSQGRF